MEKKKCYECKKKLKYNINLAKNKNNKIICDDCYSKP